MRRTTTLGAMVCAFVAFGLAACTVPDDLLTERACPCIDGWVCQGGVCLRGEDPTDGGTRPDGGPNDAGAQSDGAMADLSVSTDAFVEADGGPAGPALVAHWACDSLTAGAAGSTMADESGNGHTASCITIECPALVTGRVGDAACSFAGAQELRAGPDEAFDPTEGFSVTTWVKVPFGGGAQSLVAMPYGSGVLNSWQLYLPIDLPISFVTTDGELPEALASEVALGDDVWQHVAMTWDGVQTKIYIDGELTGEQIPPTLSFALQPILIGRDENEDVGAIFGLTGTLDEIRIYDGALGDDAIRALASVP